MTRFLLLLLFVTLCTYKLSAQTQKRVYLFEKYTKGAVWMHNHTVVPVHLNYDAANQNMMYIEGNNEMILEDIQRIDTVFIGGSKFIPAGQKGFLEIVNLRNGKVYLYWKLTNRYLGKKGAYGQVMQGTAESVNLNMMKHQAGSEDRDKNMTDVYARQNENEYWLLRNKKFLKCRNMKTLLKLYSDKEELIKAYIKEHKTDFGNTCQMLELLDYCMGIDNRYDHCQ